MLRLVTYLLLLAAFSPTCWAQATSSQAGASPGVKRAAFVTVKTSGPLLSGKADRKRQATNKFRQDRDQLARARPRAGTLALGGSGRDAPGRRGLSRAADDDDADHAHADRSRRRPASWDFRSAASGPPGCCIRSRSVVDSAGILRTSARARPATGSHCRPTSVSCGLSTLRTITSTCSTSARFRKVPHARSLTSGCNIR